MAGTSRRGAGAVVRRRVGRGRGRTRHAAALEPSGDDDMKIARVEHLHADAGQRNFDFLKLTTDGGLVGWSEYNESFGGLGVSAVIDGLAPQVIGRDPRAYEAIVTQL